MNFDPRMEPFLELCSSVEEKRVRIESIETENQKEVKAKKSFITRISQITTNTGVHLDAFLKLNLANCALIAVLI